MPEAQTLLKAELQAITWDENQQVQEVGDSFAVQFNPDSLRVGYANRSAGGDQRGGSAIQYTGQGTTRLSFDLWFDVTAPAPDAVDPGVGDVRRLTEKVVSFIRPTTSDQEDRFVPPGVRFLWGTFLFEGIVDAIDESLELFSEDGKPLRAKVSLRLSKQDIQFQFANQTGSGAGTAGVPGTTPQRPARAGDSVQSMAGREGRQDDWQAIASINDIDNPRRVPAGTPLDTRTRRG